jgi:ABC-type iron transport system FetAB permease component
MAMENNTLLALYDGELVELKGKALKELLAEQNAINEKLALKEAEAEAMAQAKAAAQAKLAALGLTVEDLTALGL